MNFRATAYIAVRHGQRFAPYAQGNTVAQVTDPISDWPVVFTLAAGDTDAALEEMFEIGNKMGRDVHGIAWPTDVRSLSVGDVVEVVDDHAVVTFHSVNRFGWSLVDEPKHVVQLAGTDDTDRIPA